MRKITAQCNHLSMDTEFCPYCGYKDAVMRDPHQIEQMKNRIANKLKEKQRKKLKENDFIKDLVITLTIAAVLEWVLGKVDDNRILGLIDTSLLKDDE